MFRGRSPSSAGASWCAAARIRPSRDWKPNRLVIIEFPSMEQAKHWYDCEEYREPKAMRLRAGRTNLVFVEGV
jgi:uncharacterized protein (DUF1330 family)